MFLKNFMTVPISVTAFTKQFLKKSLMVLVVSDTVITLIQLWFHAFLTSFMMPMKDFIR